MCIACVDTFYYNREGKGFCTMGGGFNGDAFHFVCVGCDIGVEEDNFEGKPLAERSFPIAKDAIMTNARFVLECDFANS